MDRAKQTARAEAFREMHHEKALLILPNAWDVVTARLYEVEGFRAIGTTSAGIASSLGYPDGEVMSLEDNLAVCRRITSQVQIPVSIDIETGYAGCLQGLREAVGHVLRAGAAGVNVEDSDKPGCGGGGASGLTDTDRQCERIAAVREAARRAGIALVINARTDVILLHNDASDARLAEVIRRGNAYHEAGADCIFVPDMEVLGEAQIERLARQIHAPLNLIAGARTPSVPRLEQLGVARLSFGPRAMRVALNVLRDMAREWRTSGTFTGLAPPGALSYDEINAWFGRASSPAT